jgi:hypothetical protein
LRRKLEKESGQPYEEIVRLKMPAADGRMRETDAADVPTLLRLIQSIPSPKAEPFKRWPAKVGHERTSGVEKADKFALLTNIIHQEWTGLSVQAHK